MLQPLVRRTWAPRGQTPLLYQWESHDKLSAIGAISASPIRHRLGLYFDIADTNICTDDFEAFVSALLKRFSRGIILVIDRWLVHRWAARRLQRRFCRRIQIEWLPAYAPELNPVEGVWNHSKYCDLANYVPDDIFMLRKAACQSISHMQTQQTLLRSFFKEAGLKI